MSSLPPNVLYSGRESARPGPIPLQAGPLTTFFEPDTLFLRQIRLGDHEVVRAIYGAVRDQNWDTILPQVSSLQVETNPDSFRVSFDAACRRGEIDFFWKGEITGDARGTIVFRFDGEARSIFLTNRISVCLLHPIWECAGKPCTIERVDGTTELGAFPRFISPHQPFRQIRAIAHEVAPEVRAEVRFAGEVFEMEDQRNWTDASFKTYAPPLDLPHPVRIETGARIQQTVTLSLLGPSRKVLPVLQGRPPQFSISTTPILPRPAIGLGLASHGQPLSPREIERLQRLKLSHLRADLKLFEPDYKGILRRACDESQALGVSLHLALCLSDNAEAELADLVTELMNSPAKVSLWMIFDRAEAVTPEKWVRLARQQLSVLGPNILIASGTKANFCELNRRRPAPDFWALPCYAITPQIHAFDNTSLLENLGAQAITVETARQFCKQSAVISPITLKPRFPAGAASGAATNEIRELPPDVDVRQMSLFAGGWTLGSVAKLAAAGFLHSLTYFETTGWRGVMERESGSPLPELFRSAPGLVFPVYHVLAEMAGFDRICPTHSSHPLQVEGLTLLDATNRRRILVANLLGESQEIKIKTGTCRARLRLLDETTAETFLSEPETFRTQAGEEIASTTGKLELTLRPYALASVDIV